MVCTSACVCALCNSVFYPRSLPDIQGWDMLKVLVVPCDIQLPACFSIIVVESTCLCFVRIFTQVVPFIVLAHILKCFREDGLCLLKSTGCLHS